MKVSPKVNQSLRILGLTPGATGAEIRSAFRRLARTCHPDVAGRVGARRFEQIAGAYTYLKSLSLDELGQSQIPHAAENHPQPTVSAKGKKVWGEVLGWRKRKRERLLAEEEERAQVERASEAKAAHARESKIESVLARFERVVGLSRAGYDQELKECDTRDVALRLASDLPKVRHVALRRLGERANHPELLEALTDLLRCRALDEKTARLLAALPLKPVNLKKVAEALLERAGTVPSFLLSHLLRLYVPEEFDREIAEKYLSYVGAVSAAAILRAWPEEGFLSPAALAKLLEREDESFLIALLTAMKQRAVPCTGQLRERLKILSIHSNPALRVWSKALLP